MPPIDRRPHRLGVMTRADHVERFARGAGPIDWAPDELAACRLDEDVARLLAVAVLLEEDTAIFAAQARALGLDRAPDMAMFLTAWEEEEAEHGRALRCLSAGHVVGRPPSRPAGSSLKRHGQALVPARLPGRFGPVGAAFCTLGAAAEYVAIVIYTELAAWRASARTIGGTRSDPCWSDPRFAPACCGWTEWSTPCPTWPGSGS